MDNLSRPNHVKRLHKVYENEKQSFIAYNQITQRRIKNIPKTPRKVDSRIRTIIYAKPSNASSKFEFNGEKSEIRPGEVHENIERQKYTQPLSSNIPVGKGKIRWIYITSYKF